MQGRWYTTCNSARGSLCVALHPFSVLLSDTQQGAVEKRIFMEIMADVEAQYVDDGSGKRVPLHTLSNARDADTLPGVGRSIFFPITRGDWEAMSSEAQSKLLERFCPVIQAGPNDGEDMLFRWRRRNLLMISNNVENLDTHSELCLPAV